MRYGTALVVVSALACVPVAAKDDEKKDDKTYIQCEMKFSLAGWSAFYKTMKGTGTVTCDNGQSAPVDIAIKGGGLTFGKTEIDDGIGKFSGIERFDEIYGSYATAEAHGGASKSGMAQAMTKGPVSLALSGTGRGWDAGISFGKFSIKKAGTAKQKDKKKEKQG